MDAERFDAIIRAFGAMGSRRQLFRAFAGMFAGGTAALLGRAKIGAVKCLPGHTDCGGTCVDLDTDPNNCGACGNECASGVCNDGECQPPSICHPPLVYCAGNCVDVQTDPENCGACGNSCASGVCEGGECEMPSICTPPLVYCDGHCVDLETNPANCGACGAACLDGESCCGGTCADLTSTFEHCGTCGNVCGAFEGSSCCGGACVNLFGDPFNCGGCGIVCPSGAVCVRDPEGPGAICVCPEGLTLCGDACVDLLGDPDNCGACGNACGADETCSGGVCVGGEPVVAPTATTTPEPTTTPRPTVTTDTWRLWTGETQLRGAHILQRRVDPDHDDPALGAGPVGPVYARADFTRLASRGANFIEIVHPVPVTQNPPYKSYTKLRDNLDRLVDQAYRAGLFVVIGFRNGPGRSERALDAGTICEAGGCLASGVGSGSATLWDDEDAQDAWGAAWTATARRFRGHPAVVGYDLVVAPDAPSLTAWERLAGRLIDAVREGDPDTPVLVSLPPNPADLLDFRPPDDDHAVYRLELFPPDRYLLQEVGDESMLTYPGRFDPALDGEEGRFDRSWVEERTLALEAFARRHDAPVAIGAYGTVRWQTGAADYLTDVLAVVETAALNHGLWLWTPEGWAGDDAFDVERGSDPNQGEAVPNDLFDAVRATWKKNETKPEEA